MQANYGENEIKSVLQKARIFKREIGTYQVFAINENFDYVVKLSNGRIVIKLENLQDDERDALTPEALTVIANRFSHDHQTLSQPEVEPAPQKSTAKPVSHATIKILLIATLVLALGIGSFFVWNHFKKGESPAQIPSVQAVLPSSSSAGSSVTASSPAPPREKTSQELRQELMEKEKSSPQSYLTVTYRIDRKVHLLKESEDVITGRVFNSATMATFKDIGLKVQFLTNTDVVLSETAYSLYDYVTPNGSKDFQIKVVSPQGTKTIGVTILSASAK
jgi:hypothetical protein